MKLIFETGAPGRHLTLLPPCDVPQVTLSQGRTQPLVLPEVSETELTRHYTALSKRVHGVNDGFYPLGSCTMKYNPKINEDMAALPDSLRSILSSLRVPFRAVWRCTPQRKRFWARSPAWTP